MKETNFILTEEQEEKLIEYACKRIEQLKEDNKERIEVDREGGTYTTIKEMTVKHTTLSTHTLMYRSH